MTKFPTGLFNQLSVIRGIHQVVEVRYFSAGHFDQRDSCLTIMQRDRGDNGTDRQADIIGVQMQFIAVP